MGRDTARVCLYTLTAMLERVDSYCRHRGGISRSKAITELVLHALASELLEIREEVIVRAIEASKQDLEVHDGDW